MRRNLRLTIAALLSAAAAGALVWLVRAQTAPADAVRRLAGMRVAAELYRQETGALPQDFNAIVAAGKLEAVPLLKLRWRPPCSRVRNYPSLRPRGSGCWGYVGERSDPDFGSVFIDSAARDPAGRFWTWF